MSYALGIDIGSISAKAVLMDRDSKIICWHLLPSGFDTKKTARQLLEGILSESGKHFEDLCYIVSTGYSRKNVDFASKVVEMTDSSGEVIKSIFQIWDLAGQLEFKEVRASFYGGCQGVLLVFDLTRKDTMDKLTDWILEAAKNAGGSIKGFYLIGNK